MSQICIKCGKNKVFTGNMCNTCYQYTLYHTTKRRHDNKQHTILLPNRIASTCKTIRKHHGEMKDDPEHLTTEFIQQMINVKCD